MDEEKFTNVFRDAHIVDLDWSVWDQRCRLVVIAVEETVFPAKRLPLYCIDFLNTREFVLRLADAPKLAEGHYQWRVDEIDVRFVDELVEVQLSGRRNLPVMTIRCGDVRIEHLNAEVLDQLFPGWSRPSSPLARPGILELARRAGIEWQGRVWI